MFSLIIGLFMRESSLFPGEVSVFLRNNHVPREKELKFPWETT
jgi:hypothetical protein